ncbi:MAG: transcriptional repressor LexA [Neomegalonema sp.]|nr:transcriptional repressor LexA [Neomegalonema sp.]
MLTKKQYDLLLFIDTRIRESGVSPSFDEMKEALGLKSKSGIHRLITALEERDFIRRLPHRARALEVLRIPENMAGQRAGGDEAAPARPDGPRISRPGSPSLSVISGRKGDGDGKAQREPNGAAAHHGGQDRRIPLVGKIAAGIPIEALENPLDMIEPPSAMLAAGGEHFALEVQGDSMVDAGILDGDIAVIQRRDTAQNGEIVVALVEDADATLKRYRSKGGAIALEPANENYETRVYAADQVSVQGRLVGIIRMY